MPLPRTTYRRVRLVGGRADSGRDGAGSSGQLVGGCFRVSLVSQGRLFWFLAGRAVVVERRRKEVVRMDMVEERCIVYAMRSLEYAGAGRSRDGTR